MLWHWSRFGNLVCYETLKVRNSVRNDKLSECVSQRAPVILRCDEGVCQLLPGYWAYRSIAFPL